MNRLLRAAMAPAIAAALTVPLAASKAAAGEPELLRLTAFSIDLNNRTRTNTIDIVIERWTTDEEAANFKAILIEKGREKLLTTLQKVKPRCGYARTSTSIGWDIYFARQTPLASGGRKIVLASDRPISTWEARNNGRSMDYEFSLAEIRIGADGKGEGKAIKAAKVEYNKETNTLEIEDYQREPVRLNEVKIVEPKK
jgi:hypothetical protein